MEVTLPYTDAVCNVAELSARVSYDAHAMTMMMRAGKS